MKNVIIIVLILSATLMFGNSIKVCDTKFSLPNRVSNYAIAKSFNVGHIEDASISMIFGGSTLLAFSMYSVAGLIMMTAKHPEFYDKLLVDAASSACVFGMSSLVGLLVTPGIVLTIIGNIFYYKYRKEMDSKMRYTLLECRSNNFKIMGIATGIVSGVGTLFVGGGIAMLSTEYYTLDRLSIAGLVFAVVGGVTTLVSLPLMIAALAMSGWLLYEKNHISFETSLIKNNTYGKDGYEILLGVKITI